jgi:hypothetical protein
VWEPVSEVALQSSQVGAGGTVADVAVGPDEVVRGLLHTQPRQCLPVEVVQGGGRGVAGEVMDGQHAGVAMVKDGELSGVPVADRAAQQQVLGEPVNPN